MSRPHNVSLEGAEIMKCPKCETELAIDAALPSEQVMYFTLNYEGDLLSAKTVHGTLAALEKALLLVAKNMDCKASVFVHSIEQKPHQLKVGLLLTAKPNA